MDTKRDEEPVEFKNEPPLVLDLNSKEVNAVGYYIKDLQEYLTSYEFRAFNEFMQGQTVSIINNRQVVHKYDYDRWREQYDRYKTL